MTRHEMREFAFLLTFERIFNNDSLESIIEAAKECETVTINANVEKLFFAIDEKKEELDAEISKYLKSWTIERISKVALAILRVAVYEILYSDDLEIDISISEAVRIAQDYTSKEDVSFINGVLASIAKDRE